MIVVAAAIRISGCRSAQGTGPRPTLQNWRVVVEKQAQSVAFDTAVLPTVPLKVEAPPWMMSATLQTRARMLVQFFLGAAARPTLRPTRVSWTGLRAISEQVWRVEILKDCQVDPRKGIPRWNRSQLPATLVRDGLDIQVARQPRRTRSLLPQQPTTALPSSDSCVLILSAG